MTQFILTVFGYASSGIILLFTLMSFWGLKCKSDRLIKRISGFQISLMFLFHIAAYLIYFYLTGNVDYLFFYAYQAVVFLAFCVLSRAVYPRANRFLLNHICFLLMTGMVILTRISYQKSMKQFIIASISLVITLILPGIVKHMKFLASLPAFYSVLGIGLLGVVYFYGAVTNGSKISYTVFGYTFQPSEFVKIIYVFFLASFLYQNIKFHRVIISAIVACIHVVLLVLSKDLGSALIFFIAYFCILFVSTKKPFYLLLGLLSAGGASYVAYRLFTHVQVRFLAWTDPWTNIDKEGYQITQSLFAICSGKWFGLGLMQGSPTSIPFVEADFVFSAVAQELGVVFAVSLILLYLSCFLHILKISKSTHNCFYRLIGVGLSVIMIFQVFLTIGGGIKLIPSTGVTLPLISYGGSSVMSTLFMFGILIGISLIASKEEQSGNAFETGYHEGYDGGFTEGFNEGFQTAVSGSFDLAAVDNNGRIIGFNYDEYGYAYDSLGNIYTQEGYPCDENGIVYDRNEHPEIYQRKTTQAMFFLKGISNIGGYSVVGETGESGSKHKKTRFSNMEINSIGIGFAALFLFMCGFIIQYVYQKDIQLISNDYNPVQSILIRQNNRGTIYSHDGDILAFSEKGTDGSEERFYPYDSLFCHVVGYSTYGRSGIEDYANSYLIQCNAGLNTKMEAELNNDKNPGDSVYTTLDVDIQKAAKEALGMYTGAIILTDVKSGEIICMYSNPGFNPNEIQTLWEGLVKDESSTILLNRATQGLYPPGSTFKICTALEYIREYEDAVNHYSFSCQGKYSATSGVIHCYHSMSHGTVDFRKSFAKSCNSSFAKIGLSLDKEQFGNTLQELLFNKPLPYNLNYSMSSVTMNNEISEYDCMQTSIGQGTTLITPLHLNLITCAIANQGVLMEPHLIIKVMNADGNVIETFNPKEYKRLMSEEESKLLIELMTAVVEEGTGKRLSGQSYTAAGKTGSAEYNSQTKDSHAWFTGFAPAEDPQVAVTVIVEGVGSGGDFAVPIARKVFDAYFTKMSNN